AWSPNGVWLAIGFSWDVRVYEHIEFSWRQVCRFKQSSLVGWDGNYLVAATHEKFQCSHHTIRQFPERAEILHIELAGDYRWHGRGVDAERRLFAYGGEKKAHQYFAVHDYLNNRAVEHRTGRLFSSLTSRIWFNLAQNQVLCSRSGSSYG